MKLILGLVGKICLFFAAVTILAAMSFFVLGTYAASYPIMRISPRDRRLQAILGLGVAAMTTARAYGLDKLVTTATGDTETTDKNGKGVTQP